MKLGGEIKTRRLSVRYEYEFVNARARSLPSMGKESKLPDEKLTGHLVLATSYSRTACRRTTIGAAAFHFRVRNGNGWCHYAIVTRVQNRTGGSLLSQRRKREAESLETAGFKFRKNTIFNRHSQVANRKSFLIRWHLHTGFRKQIR